MSSTNSHAGTNDIFATPDSLISQKNPYPQVANFSQQPVRIQPGEVLGVARNPSTCLDTKGPANKLHEHAINAHINVIRALAEDIMETPEMKDKDHARNRAVEGGPKAAKTAEENLPANRLFDEIGLSKDLDTEQL